MIRSYITLVLLCCALFLQAQNPIKWSFSTKDAGNCQVDLIITGVIEDGWYTYSQFLESDEGPVPTSLTFNVQPNFVLVGKAKEGGEIIKVHDKVFDMNLTKFKHKAIFTQRVEVKDPSKPIEGYMNYMACNDEMCLPPKDVDFKFNIGPLSNCGGSSKNESVTPTAPQGTNGGEEKKNLDEPIPPGTDAVGAPPVGGDQGTSVEAGLPTPPNDANFKGFFSPKRDIDASKFINDCGGSSATSTDGASIASLFLLCFLGGLIALLTPCVFPMIPMTVSFFVKRSKDRKTGLRNALIYATSIVVIFVALGVALTSALGPSILNEMSTNKWFNLAFFIIFVIFALSFFGLFEITLPSSLINKSDSMADKGGLIGTFFMAFTLVLVSFSCTGPIVGSLLVQAAQTNAGASLMGFIPLKPFIGMLGFGMGLALPFALFAMFPGWLNSLPKSGGWMDNVKITLGILELALALKFFSTADMVEQWGLLRFETFLVLWVLLALWLGLYQFGIPKWKGNENSPGPVRMVIGATSLAFAVYMGWGLLKYQSLSLLSGLAPPVHYSYKYAAEHNNNDKHDGPGCPHGLNCYHDFDVAVEEAKKQNKPLFVDFTGHGCVNCRKMEETVWPLDGIIDRLRNDYVVVSLYVDEKVRIFPDNPFAYLQDPKTGEKLRTVGSKWASFQVNNFNVSAQPYYVLMHNDGKTLLNQPTDYVKGQDPAFYRSFLECGLDAFKEIKEKEGKSMIGMN